MSRRGAGLVAAALALLVPACAAPDGNSSSRLEDRYSTSRPSNSPVLFPGEHRGLRVEEVWRLPE
jgi:hypothetical protein